MNKYTPVVQAMLKKQSHITHVQKLRKEKQLASGRITPDEYEEKIEKIKQKHKTNIKIIRRGFDPYKLHPAHRVQLLLGSGTIPRIKWLAGEFHRGVFNNDGAVYFAETEHGIYKIGYTANGNPQKRINQWKTGCPFKVWGRFFLSGDGKLEREFHRIFSDVRLDNGEWFSLRNSDVEVIETEFGAQKL